MSLPCRRYIGSSFVSTLSVRHRQQFCLNLVGKTQVVVLSPPCLQDIGSSFVSTLSGRHRQQLCLSLVGETQVVVMFPLVDETQVVVMSSPCRRDIGSSYISLLSTRHRQQLCLFLVGETYCFCPVCSSQKFVHTRRLHFKCLKLSMFAYHHIKIYIYICSYNRLPRLFNFEGVISHLVVIENNLMRSGRFVSVSNFRYSNQTQINDIFEIKWMI